jgi:hypothetical protein
MNDIMHQSSSETNVGSAERELALAREHFKSTLRDVSTASKAVVQRALQSGKPLLVGVVILAGVALLLGTRAGRRRPLIQIRVVAPTPSWQGALVRMGAQAACDVLASRQRCR